MLPESCNAIKARGWSSGTYVISPSTNKPDMTLSVYCDLSTEPATTVIHHNMEVR